MKLQVAPCLSTMSFFKCVVSILLDFKPTIIFIWLFFILQYTHFRLVVSETRVSAVITDDILSKHSHMKNQFSWRIIILLLNGLQAVAIRRTLIENYHWWNFWLHQHRLITSIGQKLSVIFLLLPSVWQPCLQPHIISRHYKCSRTSKKFLNSNRYKIRTSFILLSCHFESFTFYQKSFFLLRINVIESL